MWGFRLKEGEREGAATADQLRLKLAEQHIDRATGSLTFLPLAAFQLRGDTTVYVFPGKDRVIIIYTMHYDDKVSTVSTRTDCFKGFHILLLSQRQLGAAIWR